MDDTLKLFEHYLSGNLNQKEMEVFENRLNTDKELAAEFELFKDMMGGLRLRNNKQLKNRLNEIHAQEIDKSAEAVLRPIRWKSAFAVAAACLVLITAYFVLCNDQLSPEAIYASHFEPYEPDWTTRGTEDELTAAQVKNLYEDKQYQELAQVIFADSLQRKLTSVKFTMIKGIVSLEIDRYEEARRYFNSVANNPLLQAEAQWYTALSYLKENNIEKCKEILEQFAKDNSSDYHEEAVRILKDL